ncbi:MAG: FtsK/SpoIIIE domain-containing protein [Microthrixaceae bacterium]
MKLRVTLRRPAGSTDVAVDTDATATIGDIAAALARRDPGARNAPPAHSTLSVQTLDRPATTLDPALPVTESGLGSGQYVEVVPAPPGSTSAAAQLTVIAGPGAGRTYDLRRGVNTVGREASCDVHLDDSLVSKRHARIIVGDTVEIVDDNSSNGIMLGAHRVQRAEVAADTQLLLGDSLVVIRRSGSTPAPGASRGGVPFTRSPRLDPQYEGPKLEAPDPPQPTRTQRFPLITFLVPLLLGGVIFAATESAIALVFVAFSPLMIVGSYYESKRNARLDKAEATDLFREQLAQFVAELRTHQDDERRGRLAEAPATTEIVAGIQTLSPLLWTRRPEHTPFGSIRLGIGRQPSRIDIEVMQQRNTFPELRDELLRTVEPFRIIDNVPVVAALGECGSIGVAGPEPVRSDVARSLVTQFVGLHSPAEAQLGVLASPTSASTWEWVKWLPHVDGDHCPIDTDPLSTTAPGCAAIIGELSDLVERRLGDPLDSDEDVAPLPLVLLVVEHDAPVDRPQIVALMERGPEAGVHVLWSAPSVADIPAAARTFLECDPVHGAATGKVIEAERVQPVVIEPLDRDTAEWIARRLAPVFDAGSDVEDDSDIPVSVSFLNDAGPELATDPNAIIERWRESNSLRSPGQPGVPNRRANDLRGLVGRTALDPLHLDLRSQGPHALVGGTTGSGKSEFLQTWILGMATAHSPQRVTFLFIDYKGGAAFADCVSLPHSVGLVTDLSQHLVQRALISLRAEVRYREQILNMKKAKDLLELERRNEPDCPPSLVIVIDEFAALVQEVPEFIDGVVDVAQRGRSLGLHLILATQRPAGVIKDNLRANTNLRVALRMADEDDSHDVIGTPLAGSFDPSIPGRAVAKTGPGRLSVFQAGYVGGWTSGDDAPASITVRTLHLGDTEEWLEPDHLAAGGVVTDPGPTDIQRVVTTIQQASSKAQLEAPRRPWLPELAATYELAELPMPRRDSELVFGVADHPDQQRQAPVAFRPDVEGNMAVFGTGGAGKSAFLRTIAVAAGLTARGGPCFVYGLDFASRGLSMLETLPHVGSVIPGEDTERTIRLLRELRDTIDERAARFAAVNAGTIEEYRRLANQPDEPRILLLLDGLAAFRSAFEAGPMLRIYEQFMSIAADGRPVGVHVVLAADRAGAMPAALGSSVQRRLALRLSEEIDESMLGVPRGGFADDAPAGRAFLGGLELQVAVLGGSNDVTAQAAAIGGLAASMRRAGAASAPPIEKLPEFVDLAALPVRIDDLPTLGMSDDGLEPVGFDPSGMFLVTGPTGSGRSSAVAAMVTSLERDGSARNTVYFGTRRSPLAAHHWSRSAIGAAEWSALADELTSAWEPAGAPANTVVILDGLGEMTGSDAEYPMQDLLRTCRAHGVFVIADGETQDVQGSWPLVQAIKSSRHGIVLQPDQMDGDTLFRVSFPRMSRADFPAGRGMYVRNGRAVKVQIATS